MARAYVCGIYNLFVDFFREYRKLQAKLFELWDQYEAKERSAKSLLKACSHLNGPRES